ncbi:hypothetical protein [Pseudoalteromonas ruthenica]|uniref:hypothetical protein n=1 Tax=Pseudoalteromonas ruthenica TaxID=151081 RepID=UPI00241DE4AB|nr:hypothetical protein [Pseudoalteromonas ruthenica]|tara:strand:+ start:49747 stop:49971 length:225 start_codon:yes stop_codon:yes gene_type:complete
MSNPLSRLTSVLANKQRTVVEVVQVHANDTTTVRHTDSSETTAIGSSVASGKAYLEDGRIIGPAPDLQYFEIEV